jgi:hemoglobin-like flavoprotein
MENASMSLSQAQIDRLVACFLAVELRLDELEDMFYTILFDRAPQFRKLFPDDLSSQKHHMGEALKLLAMNVTDLDEHAGVLREMGTRHAGYGTEVRDYPIVCEAMVSAFEHISGDLWTEQLKEDWSAVFEIVSAYMIEGQTYLDHLSDD